MSNTEIRVVTGPANYFSHPGSLVRLNDFSLPTNFHAPCGFMVNAPSMQPALTCQRLFILPRLNTCCLRDIAAKPMLLNWQKSRERIVVW